MSNPTWRNDLEKTFQRFDSDDNGKIDHKEFDQLLDALGSEMSARDRELGFGMIDSDEDGAISFDELASWWDVVREEGTGA
jgi:Ca2+-binding EF-hand superfamily protein